MADSTTPEYPIEQAAKAAHDAAHRSMGVPPPDWDTLTHGRREHFRTVAAAAVDAWKEARRMLGANP